MNKVTFFLILLTTSDIIIIYVKKIILIICSANKTPNGQYCICRFTGEFIELQCQHKEAHHTNRRTISNDETEGILMSK